MREGLNIYGTVLLFMDEAQIFFRGLGFRVWGITEQKGFAGEGLGLSSGNSTLNPKFQSLT